MLFFLNILKLKIVYIQDKEYRKVKQLLSRALNDLDKLKQHVDVGKGGRKRAAGGGRKPTCPEIGAALFPWFIDMRVGLKTCVSTKIFNAKCLQLHKEYLATKRENNQVITQDEKNMKFTRQWDKRCLKVFLLFLFSVSMLHIKRLFIFGTKYISYAGIFHSYFVSLQRLNFDIVLFKYLDSI